MIAFGFTVMARMFGSGQGLRSSEKASTAQHATGRGAAEVKLKPTLAPNVPRRGLGAP